MEETKNIKTVTFIGSGNVATALAKAFNGSGIIINEIFSLSANNAIMLSSKIGCSYTNNINKINLDSDLYIISTPDRAIKKVAKKLKNCRGIVAHTSGSVAMDSLSGINKYGVFYPLQTFTKNREVNFNEIPICIEANNLIIEQKLINLAHKISDRVEVINTQQRGLLHLNAVTVNNFTNWLYGYAYDVLDDNDIDFSLLHPLITETANKIIDSKPSDIQTGPARRNDSETITNHLKMLDEYPEYKKIYSLITKQIIGKYHDKL